MAAPSAELMGEGSFEEMGLDARLLRALLKKNLQQPTAVQAKAIPLALEGKDIVARARTGSGKTLAYLLPMLHKILTGESEEQVGASTRGIKALVLVPTRELCQQVRDEVASLAEHCGGVISAVQLTATMTQPAQRAALGGSPDVVVATPGRIAQALRDGSLAPAALQEHLQTLVLDEADLLLSYGYEEDLRTLAQHVPRRTQCLLMSATTSPDVERLKKLVLHNPVTLTLAEVDGSAAGGGVAKTVQQFYVKCSEKDKLLHTMCLLRLGLLQKKALIFVNKIDTGFQLKLFLEQFGVKSAVLNSELPQNSRQHILQEFNKGLFDYLIATDDSQAPGPSGRGGDEKRGGGEAKSKNGGLKKAEAAGRGDAAAAEGEGGGEEEAPQGAAGKKKKRKRSGDGEFGVVRGVDFKNVRTVINFDLPPTPSAYVHRIGRTGRAGSTGMAVSLVRVGEQEELLGQIERQLAAEAAGQESEEDEAELPVIAQGSIIAPFPSLTKNAVESLRYRAEDVARSVTKAAVREARAKELKLEIINSERLKSHFEDNPVELELLKHDKPLLKVRSAAHLKAIPAYARDSAVEAAARQVKAARAAMGGVDYFQRRRQKRRASDDPLRSFAFQKKMKGQDDDPPEVAAALAGTLYAKKKERAAKKGRAAGGRGGGSASKGRGPGEGKQYRNVRKKRH